MNRTARAVAQFSDLPGRGVKGTLEGHPLIMGNHRLIEEKGLCVRQVHEQLLEFEKQGYTVTVLASEAQVLAIFAVADRIKESSVKRWPN